MIAPPYDVIDARGAGELVERSPHNVVELDLPRAEGGDPYEHAAELLERWTDEGACSTRSAPAIWALEQDYTAPGRRARRAAASSPGSASPSTARARAPHERTQPGPKEDRLRLTRATRHNLSPIFVLHAGDAWRRLAPAPPASRSARSTDDDGTVHRAWPVERRRRARGVAAELAERASC